MFKVYFLSTKNTSDFILIFRLQYQELLLMRSTQRKFILHIEDDQDDQLMLKEAIKEVDSSLEVWNAQNGQEGLEILMQCTLINYLPSLIILDLNLPGLDGKKLLMEIKKHTVLSSIPVVIFTTSSSELDKLFASKENVKLYSKPSQEAEFFRVVKIILETSFKASE